MSTNATNVSGAGPDALQGLRVVDVSRYIAGPYCAMLLGDMGADVIKVEPPGRGENSRAYGPFVNGESLYTMVFNRNKRSLTLDLRNDQGKDLLRELLCDADVLVENFVPGTLEKMGFDWDTLQQLNPKLILTRISGFGQTGPLSATPCFDVIAQTRSGLMEVTGDPGGHPTMAGTYIVDYTTGMYATIGTLGALQARQTTGKGQVVDVALMDSAMSMLMTAIPEQALHGRTMTRHGNRDRYAAPANTFATGDGAWVHLVVAGDIMFRRLAQSMGNEGLADDARFASNAARMQNVEELEQIISDWTKSLDCADLLDRLAANGVPAARVASVADLVNDEQVAHREQVLNMEHSTAGSVPMQGFSIRFGQSPMRLRHPPPSLGEQTDTVLAEWLNMSPEKIAELRTAGVI
jgi:crotonobetainyl-CoA:carnitine CoA-transferase CaiB-like acyl-CoA transferase